MTLKSLLCFLAGTVGGGLVVADGIIKYQAYMLQQTLGQANIDHPPSSLSLLIGERSWSTFQNDFPKRTIVQVLQERFNEEKKKLSQQINTLSRVKTDIQKINSVLKASNRNFWPTFVAVKERKLNGMMPFETQFPWGSREDNFFADLDPDLEKLLNKEFDQILDICDRFGSRD